MGIFMRAYDGDFERFRAYALMLVTLNAKYTCDWPVILFIGHQKFAVLQLTAIPRSYLGAIHTVLHTADIEPMAPYCVSPFVPESPQKAPCMLGDVSPTLLWPNAAMKPGAKPLPVSALAARSMICEAPPLLSPLIRVLVLLMEVQCTGNQLTAPRPLHVEIVVESISKPVRRGGRNWRSSWRGVD